MTPSILAINGGSSSIRFALYAMDNLSQSCTGLLLRGKINRIGLSGTKFIVNDAAREIQYEKNINTVAYEAVVAILLTWFEAQPWFKTVQAAGHRVVHGMAYKVPQRVTPAVLETLYQMIPFDPVHMSYEINLIHSIQKRHPTLLQIVCFDTAFHSEMPRIATLLPIPRCYEAKGVKRYGFHGLSYSYLMEELIRLGDSYATKGRVILAHLGNGASMVAVLDGKSIDTSMGFTPASGLVMSNRSGDIDPGLISFMQRSEQMSVAQFEHMVNYASGLLGISETSSDMHDLLDLEKKDSRAAQAIALFCYQAKKWIGSFAAALGGLDTLVFAGGIGENAPLIRKRICDGLGFLDIELNPTCNSKNTALISKETSRVKVRVIHTDEELMIARSVYQLLGANTLMKDQK